jgi:hypothetical protein
VVLYTFKLLPLTMQEQFGELDIAEAKYKAHKAGLGLLESEVCNLDAEINKTSSQIAVDI